jgi:hypothetical protein
MPIKMPVRNQRDTRNELPVESPVVRNADTGLSQYLDKGTEIICVPIKPRESGRNC